MDRLDYFETHLPAPSHKQTFRVLLNRMMKSNRGRVGVRLLHYRLKEELKYSLIWVCRPLCILAFEHSRFMGRA